MIKTETKVLGNAKIAFRTSGVSVDANDRYIGIPDFGGTQQECAVTTGSKNDIRPVYQIIGIVHTLHFFGFYAASF